MAPLNSPALHPQCCRILVRARPLATDTHGGVFRRQRNTGTRLVYWPGAGFDRILSNRHATPYRLPIFRYDAIGIHLYSVVARDSSIRLAILKDVQSRQAGNQRGSPAQGKSGERVLVQREMENCRYTNHFGGPV